MHPGIMVKYLIVNTGQGYKSFIFRFDFIEQLRRGMYANAFIKDTTLEAERLFCEGTVELDVRRYSF